MAGLFSSIAKGYADAILGPDTSAQYNNTASAWDKLNSVLNDKYANEKQMFETNPDNAGKEYQAPDPFTRFRDQVSAMISSGDPGLQQRGLALLSAPSASSSTPAAIKEYQFAKGQGYDGSFQDWKASQKAGTTVNVNTGNQRGQYLTEEEKVAGGLDPNAPFVWTQDGPKPVAQSKESELQKPINVAEATVNDLDAMLFGDQGLYADYKGGTTGRMSEVIKANVEKYAQNDPRYAMYDQTVTASLSPLARSIGGEKGALAEGDVERVKSLLPVLTGLNPDTPQVARQKIRRLRNMVALARKKGGLTSEEVKKYTTGFAGQVKKREASNDFGVPESLQPRWNTLPSGAKYRVIE